MSEMDLRADIESIYDEAEMLCSNAFDIIKQCTAENAENEKKIQMLSVIEEKYHNIENIIAN